MIVPTEEIQVRVIMENYKHCLHCLPCNSPFHFNPCNRKTCYTGNSLIGKANAS